MQATSTSSWRLADLFDGINRTRAEVDEPSSGVSEGHSDDLDERPLHIVGYLAEFSTPVDWLANVERRIQDSVSSPDQEASCEWLTPDAASTARFFLRDTCDLLPGEPHIYGTQEGDLVAEFETHLLRMTSVASSDGTKLFGYRRDNDDMPLHVEILRGCNRHRDEVKEFTQALGIDSHGKTLESES